MIFEKSDDLVSVFRAHGELEGEMIRSFLEAQGIQAMVVTESLGRIYGATVGEIGASTIYVKRVDEAEAVNLLKQMINGEFENEKLAECPTGCEIFGPHSKSIDDPALDQRKRVLILGTDNSTRSQMAEAAVNHDLWDQWIAFSAGTNPQGLVNPLAIMALEEQGIFHQGFSKGFDLFLNQNFDLVLTVTDEAERAFPAWLEKEKHVHLGLSNPTQVEGNDHERYKAIRSTLVIIRSSLIPLLRDR